MSALRVLVVEDDALIGMMIADTLVGMGHDVSAIAATEAEAVAAVARYRPQLMIVDVRLGDGSGISVVDVVCRAGPVPHVFVTGGKIGDDTLRPNAVVVRKPFRDIDLARAVRRAIGAPEPPKV